jgi:hypothetical protein
MVLVVLVVLAVLGIAVVAYAGSGVTLDRQPIPRGWSPNTSLH